jgi:N-acetylgalactosamine-6-sulfatase
VNTPSAVNRRRFLKLAGLGAAALVSPRAAAGGQAGRRPNFIFILTDDQGWADSHFNGHPYLKTPTLDRLAREGSWFKQFYVANPVCSPSRTAFMTSHYPARHLVHGHFATTQLNKARCMPDWLDPGAATLPRLLKEAGYATGHFGKWHLGSGPGAPLPAAYGIDDSKTVNSNGPALGGAGAEEKDPYFRAKSTAMIVDEAIRFVTANKDKPFYLNVWTLLPHAPLNPTPEQLKVYEDLTPSASDPGFGQWMQKYLAAAKDLRSQMRIFCASVTNLDAELGRLLKALDDLGLAQGTLIFYSSDNGPEDYHIGNAANAGVGSTGPLRARKRSLYEGGVRTPCLVRWPGRVAAGRVDEQSVLASVDFLPSVCRLAGAAVPETVKPDGEDTSDIWLGKSRPRTRPIFWEWLFAVAGDQSYLPPPLAVRDGQWKLLTGPDRKRAELYDIPKDPAEDKNVAGEHPDVVERLSAEVLAWQKTLPESPLRTSGQAKMPPAAKKGK